MITFTCALYGEAAPLILRYQMKKVTEETEYRLFLSEDKNTRLLITGAGMIPSAMAITWLYTKYGVSEGEHLINVGTACGFYRGFLYLGNKLWDMNTGRSYFPDMLVDSGVKEVEIATYPLPAESFELALLDRAVYDMEAAAIYQAGIRVLGPHQMSFLKIVSDRGVNDANRCPDPGALTEEHLDEICDYANRVRKAMTEGTGFSRALPGAEKEAAPEIEEELSRLSEGMRLSETMRLQLKQILLYCRADGIEYRGLIDRWKAEGRFPCGSKTEGKLLLDQLKSFVR